jgi:NADPH:quinone reductase-like Zn-dependent oxidoreductase
VIIHEHGGLDALVVEERPDREPAPGEVRVRIRAAALNHLDLWVRKGVPGVRYPLPIIPGCDGSGIVDRVGEGVTGIEPGSACVIAPGVSCGRCEACSRGEDHLCRWYGILGEHRDGTCADLITLPARNILPKPENLSFEEAAAFGLSFLTAWHMVFERARLRPGETVLIHAAGSGVSTAALQMADLLGARILATAGSDEKLTRARDLGARETINYRTTDFAAEVRRLTGKRGADVILDHVGRDTWNGNIRSLAKGGRLVICGNTSGREAVTSLPHVFFKNLSLLGSTMGSRAELYEVIRLLEGEILTPVVDRVLPMAEIREAHRVLEDREVFGKVVVTPW